MNHKTLLSGLAPNVQDALLDEARRLLDLLPPNVDLSMRLECAIQNHLVGSPSGDVTRIQRVSWPLAAFLAARVGNDMPRRDELDRLRAWALAAALVFCAANAALSDHDPPIPAGLRAIRRLSTRRDLEEARKEMPTVPNDMAAVTHMLDSWETRLAQRAHPYEPRVAEMRRLIELLPNGKASPRRNRSETSPAIATDATPICPPTPTPDANTGSRVIRAISPGQAEEDGPRNAEEASDLASTSFVDLGIAEPEDSPARATFETQLELIEANEDGGAGWVGAYAALAPEELRMLFEGIRSEIDSGAPQQGALTCGLVLLTGRTVAQLCDLRTKAAYPGESWRMPTGLAFSPDVTGSNATKPFKNNMMVELAPPFANALEKLAFCPVAEAEQLALTWLQRALPSGRAPRLSRLSRAMADQMRAAGEDEAVIGLLNGVSVSRLTQLYYANFPVVTLDAAYQTCLERLGGQGCARVAARRKTARVGSLRAPSRAEVQDFFATLDARLDDAHGAFERTIQGLPDLVAAVNNRAAAVLNLALARRPHGPAFEPLQIVGERRPRVRINDKGSRLVSDARWLPLPPFALMAIKEWRADMERIEARLGPRGASLNPDLFAYLQAAKAGQTPPFFTMGHLGEAPEPLSAAVFWDRAGTPGSSPRNWARHFLRRELPEAGLSGALVDAFMGHGGAVADPLAPTSGASLAQLDALTEAIEAICAPLVTGGTHV